MSQKRRKKKNPVSYHSKLSQSRIIACNVHESLLKPVVSSFAHGHSSGTKSWEDKERVVCLTLQGGYSTTSDRAVACYALWTGRCTGPKIAPGSVQMTFQTQLSSQISIMNIQTNLIPGPGVGEVVCLQEHQE